MIKNTAMACKLSGMPPVHADCFQRIADQTNCIISCRSVGKYATGLILEGYSPKGFHVRVKSCNWGPMAGFVLADPRFSKKGTNTSAVVSQIIDIKKAKKSGARLTPVYISNARKQALLTNLRCMSEVERRSATEIVYVANGEGSPAFKFVLVQDDECPSGSDGRTWRVCYHKEVKPSGPRSTLALVQRYSYKHDPVLALTNPGANEMSYKEALTGDYDLWGIYARVSDYDATGDDLRSVKGSNHRAITNKGLFHAQQNSHVGNTTPRVDRIRDLLNQAIKESGYMGKSMVQHSDELGRPSVDEVELGFISFFPNKNGAAQFIDNPGQFQVFISQARAENYQDIYNPNWQYFHNFNNVLDQLDGTRKLYGQSSSYESR